MKHFLLSSLVCLCFFTAATAQTTPGPVEKQVTANICDCISGLDHDKIKDKPTAEKAFVDCFAKQSSLLLDLAEERNVEITDQPAMRNLGIEIGKNLMKQNCEGFMKLSMAMANTNTTASASGITEGRLKKIETKDFSYFILVDNDNKERSFIWLRQFPGSEKFVADTNKLVGKKLKISWEEMEVYVPSAKNYYSIKEVTGLEVL